jgi:hypothetical protein
VKASEDSGSSSAPNWAEFYSVLVRLGPSALIGIPADWIEWFFLEGGCSDWFWHEGIDEELVENWEESPELAVREAFQQYVWGVQAGLRELPVSPNSEGWVTCGETGALLTWDESILSIKGELAPWHVEALLAAARARSPLAGAAAP